MVLRRSCCSSQGELSPFSIELDSFVSLTFYFLLPFFAYVFCQFFVWVVFVNAWQKGKDLDKCRNMWKSFVFCWGGVWAIHVRGRYIYCFIYFLFHCLLIYIYELFIDICLYFLLCEIKNLFFIYLYFPHMRLCICWVF